MLWDGGRGGLSHIANTSRGLRPRPKPPSATKGRPIVWLTRRWVSQPWSSPCASPCAGFLRSVHRVVIAYHPCVRNDERFDSTQSWRRHTLVHRAHKGAHVRQFTLEWVSNSARACRSSSLWLHSALHATVFHLCVIRLRYYSIACITLDV